jgi:hypothetical protein
VRGSEKESCVLLSLSGDGGDDLLVIINDDQWLIPVSGRCTLICRHIVLVSYPHFLIKPASRLTVLSSVVVIGRIDQRFPVLDLLVMVDKTKFDKTDDITGVEFYGHVSAEGQNGGLLLGEVPTNHSITACSEPHLHLSWATQQGVRESAEVPNE